MTIHSIIGLMNSGKTLYMTYCLYEAYIKGYTIVTNYNINLPHYKINQDYLLSLVGKERNLNNLCFGFDEFWIFLAESRNAMSKENKLVSYLFNQSSKGHTLIYLTAQRNSQNENRIRENQHLLTICRRKLLIDNKYKDISDEYRFLPNEYQNKLYIHAKTFKQKLNGLDSYFNIKEEKLIKANIYFKLYDTTQVILNYKKNE